MNRKELTDEQWERICGFLPPERGRACHPAKDNRLMVEAILRVMRTGEPWRYLPAEYGPWQSVYTRFSRWTKAGIWKRILEELSTDAQV